jgi:hypothetical protein
VIVDGPSASAARISARFVSDFEPGSATVAEMGRYARGAFHRFDVTCNSLPDGGLSPGKAAELYRIDLGPRRVIDAQGSGELTGA